MKRTPVLLTILLVLFSTLSLSGCSTVRNMMGNEDTVTAPAKTGADITLPPIIPRAESDKVVETRPEDTISFDEWRKQREETLKTEAAANKSSPD